MLIKWLQSKLGKTKKMQRTKVEIYLDSMEFKAGYDAYHSDMPWSEDATDLWKEGYIYALNEHKC